MLLLEIINTKVYTWIAVLWLLALYADYKYSPETFRTSLKFVLPSMLVVTTIGWRSRKLKPTRMKGMGVLVLIGTLILAIPCLIWYFLAEAITSLAKKLLGESWSTVTGWLANIPTRAWWVVIGIIAIPTVIYILSRLFRRRPSRTAGSAEEKRRSKTPKEWWKEAIVTPITIFVILIDIILWQVYPTWVWKPVTEDLIFVAFLHFAYCLALTGMATSPKWKARTAIILLVMTILALTTRTLGITPWLGESYWINQTSTQSNKPSPRNMVNSGNQSVGGPTHSAIVQKTISEVVFAQEWIPYKDKVGLIARAQEESGFRQFNDDGTILRGEVNNHDVCAFQINEDYWLEKAKELGFNIYTLDGCIQMALAIYKERGLDAWNTLKGVENVFKTVRTIDAPVGRTIEEAGEVIKVSEHSNCSGIPDKLVIAWDDNNMPHEMTPTHIPTFYTTTLRYSTPDAPAGRITYGCR